MVKYLIYLVVVYFITIPCFSDNKIVILPYNDQSIFLNSISRKFPVKTNAYVEKIRVWNIPSSTNNLNTGDVYVVNGELKIKQ